MTEPVPLLTVGDLKSELSRWSDETPVTFRSPLKEQEFRFYRYSPARTCSSSRSMNFRKRRRRRCPAHSRGVADGTDDADGSLTRRHRPAAQP